MHPSPATRTVRTLSHTRASLLSDAICIRLLNTQEGLRTRVPEVVRVDSRSNKTGEASNRPPADGPNDQRPDASTSNVKTNEKLVHFSETLDSTRKSPPCTPGVPSAETKAAVPGQRVAATAGGHNSSGKPETTTTPSAEAVAPRLHPDPGLPPIDVTPVAIDAQGETVHQRHSAHEQRKSKSSIDSLVSHTVGRGASSRHSRSASDVRPDEVRHGRGVSGAHDDAGGSVSGGGGLRRTIEWIDSKFLHATVSGGRVGSPPFSAGGGGVGGTWRGPAGAGHGKESPPSGDQSLLQRTSTAMKKVGDLGRDPREAAKLMSKRSCFVEVE